MARFRRNFVDTPDGQLHVVGAEGNPDVAPLVMLPQLGALELTRLMERIDDRVVLAIDPPRLRRLGSAALGSSVRCGSR